ncbi:hypothetical protein JW962_01115 [Candidatus Dojkabacteria bacterium]|nr:hypothetical protein [Candidatus Dojkabacteria bacterium]
MPNGINWRKSLIEYAEKLGHTVHEVKLNYVGKNMALYTDKHLKKRKNPNLTGLALPITGHEQIDYSTH